MNRYSKSVHYLSKYVSIFEFPPNAKSKEKQEIPKEFEYEYFQAHFLMAAMYSKMIPQSKAANIKNLKKSLSGYEHVVQFYELRESIEGCDIQYQIAEEMKGLLPMKISQIQQ